MLLLLYADDLTIMSTTPAGLQRQFNALQLFCEQQQLSVNLANCKVVTFSSRARCPAFTFNGNKVERFQSYKRLGIPRNQEAKANGSAGSATISDGNDANQVSRQCRPTASPSLSLLPTKQCIA